MIDRESERALFEAWYLANHVAPGLEKVALAIEDGEYFFGPTRWAFGGWLARASQPLKVRSQVIRNLWRSPQIGSSLDQFTEEFERWVRAEAVPVEVTEEMIDAGAFALMKDRHSIVQIDQHRLGGTVGWQRAKIEAKAVLTASLEGGR